MQVVYLSMGIVILITLLLTVLYFSYDERFDNEEDFKKQYGYDDEDDSNSPKPL